ncbi:MAG TPA: hypothetical protein VFI23_11980 [Rhizomicrobium sp.]|nr:hypothetical protein [Rhizomicrobium sp.]
MAKDSDFVFDSGEAHGLIPSFSDVSFQNERAMWWAEFDGVGEEAVRDSVARNSYTPTGMEVARQWLARQEFLQLREDVKAIRALAEVAQETASESLTSASEALTLASAATAPKNARPKVIVGMAVSLFALCAIVMVLSPSRQVAPNTKQASAQSSRPKQVIVRPPPPAVPPASTRQALPPETAQKKQPSNAPQISSPDLKSEGQSLAEALALIADRVGGEGTINFTAQFRDMATGRDQYEQRLYKASNVTADSNRCQVRYHWHAERQGRAVSDQDRTVELRLAKGARVTSLDGEPGRRLLVRAYPKVYVLHIAPGHEFYFYNKDMAARVVTGARRAVELCGKREPRFRGR